MTTQGEATDPIPQAELVHAIQIATDEVFTTMLNLTVTTGEVFVEKEDPAPDVGCRVVDRAGRDMGGLG